MTSKSDTTKERAKSEAVTGVKKAEPSSKQPSTTTRPNLVNLTEQASGKAFQILSARKPPAMEAHDEADAGTLPIVAGKPYDEEDRLADAILRGIHEGAKELGVAEKSEGGKRAVLLMGPPCSGKTHVLSKLIEGVDKLRTVDADALMAKLPGFKPELAHLYQREASDMAGMLVAKLIKGGYGLLIDFTGKNTKKVLAIVDELHANGYEIEAYEMRLTALKSAQRAMVRFDLGGRFFDPIYIIDHIREHPHETFDALKKTGVLKKYAAYDADVPMGAKPHLIESRGLD